MIQERVLCSRLTCCCHLSCCFAHLFRPSATSYDDVGAVADRQLSVLDHCKPDRPLAAQERLGRLWRKPPDRYTPSLTTFQARLGFSRIYKVCAGHTSEAPKAHCRPSGRRSIHRLDPFVLYPVNPLEGEVKGTSKPRPVRIEDAVNVDEVEGV